MFTKGVCQSNQMKVARDMWTVKPSYCVYENTKVFTELFTISIIGIRKKVTRMSGEPQNGHKQSLEALFTDTSSHPLPPILFFDPIFMLPDAQK